MTQTLSKKRSEGGIHQMGMVAATMVAGLLFVIASAAAPRAEARSIAVVFAPGTSFPEAATRLAALDARIEHIGRFQNVFVARFERGWSLVALWRIGALLPLNTRAGGDCGGTPSASSPSNVAF